MYYSDKSDNIVVCICTLVCVNLSDFDELRITCIVIITVLGLSIFLFKIHFLNDSGSYKIKK